MKTIKGLIMAARLTNKEINGYLEDDRAKFQIGDIYLDIYEGGKKERQVTIAPTSKEMWHQPFYVKGNLESVFHTIMRTVDDTAPDYIGSPCRQQFKNLEHLIEYIKIETGVVANDRPKYRPERYDGVIEFDEFKIILFGPYHGTVYVPEDYKLNFVLDEPV